MTQKATFDEVFSAEFESGLKDIKFFIDPSKKASADELCEDALGFQNAIKEGRAIEVAAVD